MNNNSKELTQDDIREIIYSFRESRILLTAFELGIFTEIGNGKKTSKEIAENIKTDERATDRLLNALCAIGILKKDTGKYCNSPVALQCLVKTSPDYMYNIMHSVDTWDSWSTLTEAVKAGRSVESKQIKERGNRWLDSFIEAMHYGASKRGPLIVDLLDLSDVSRVLDIGGGSGAYAMAFARAKENIKSVVFDLPEVLPLTKKYLEQEGMQDKVETIAGDYNNDEFGSGYDMIILSSIVHINSYEGNKKLVKKCADALNVNGRLVIQDFIMDEDRTTPSFGALFALNMLVATQAGDTFTEKEVSEWMENAELKNIKRIDTNFGPALIIGKKLV